MDTTYIFCSTNKLFDVIRELGDKLTQYVKAKIDQQVEAGGYTSRIQFLLDSKNKGWQDGCDYKGFSMYSDTCLPEVTLTVNLGQKYTIKCLTNYDNTVTSFSLTDSDLSEEIMDVIQTVIDKHQED